MLIESTKNETVKRARALNMKKGREEQGLHFVEGEKMLREAIQAGAAFGNCFIEAGHAGFAYTLGNAGAAVHTVSRAVMEGLCATNTPQWVCGCVHTPKTTPPAEYPEGLIVALDGVQDPGNLGTILRTADAMGAAGLLIGPGSADPYAPKPLRASMGSIYHIPVWEGDLTVELPRLKERGHTLLCGHLQGSGVLPAFRKSCTLVIGNEGKGVSDEVAELCEKYRLPMYGKAESLNAAIAAGILMHLIAERLHA